MKKLLFLFLGFAMTVSAEVDVLRYLGNYGIPYPPFSYDSGETQFGLGSSASALNATAFGMQAHANGVNGIALGQGTVAGVNDGSFGRFASTTGQNSFVFGFNASDGGFNNTFVFGNGNIALTNNMVYFGSLTSGPMSLNVSSNIIGNGGSLTNLQSANLIGDLPTISGAALTGLTPGQSASQPTNNNLTLWAGYAPSSYTNGLATQTYVNNVGQSLTNYTQPTNNTLTLLGSQTATPVNGGGITNLISTNIVTKTKGISSSYQVTRSDSVLFVTTGSFTITNVASPPTGTLLTVINKGTGTVVITNSGPTVYFTIPGLGTNNSVTLGSQASPSNTWTGVYDGSNW